MKLEFEYQGEKIEFNIVRRKRKTICIKIEEDGKIIVSAPLRTGKEYILLVVKDKVQWILDKQKEIKKRSSRKVKRDFTQGSTFMYLGREYPFKLFLEDSRKNIQIELKAKLSFEDNKYVYVDANTNSIHQKTFWEDNKFIIHTNTLDTEKLRLALEKWYRAETLKIVTKRIDYYAGNFKDKVTDIKVKEQKRRWASCTGKNAILFNWRISMARGDVLDYIVVHEMCHMDYRNHSKYFWNRVAEIMPDYKEKHEWLRKNGINLYL